MGEPLTGGQLEGSFIKTTLGDGSGTGYYKLTSDGTKFGRAKSPSTITQFRVALNLGTGSNVKELSILFDETEHELIDAIGQQLDEQEQKKDDAIYDLQGRRIYRVTIPGIYIQNGKKIVKK